MSIDKSRLKKIIAQIFECAETVIDVLGCGFEDKVYERALIYELSKNRFNIEPQYPINVYYEGIIVGDFYVDILVEKYILVEVVAVDSLTEQHKKKCVNYLKASELKACLLINFGVPELETRTYALTE
ncbi:MAG: GxxExxY protein [Xenococcaceae cyanobacterium MO_188.B29]|nr:GxxExxY protein [Xenococcaceae cyanobacterium MO_188.B29]